MDRAGERLKRVRERLKLTYRDVAQASQVVAERRGSEEFAIALSRLADIENKGTVPSIYRLYTLSTIYRVDFDEILRWYGVPRDLLQSDALHIQLPRTHSIEFAQHGTMTLPQLVDDNIDLRHTTFLSRFISRWGKVPFSFLNGLDVRQHRYGLIGLDDWSMYPVLRPGSVVVIDESRHKIATSGWSNEFDRPIYFLENRDGYICSWCHLQGDRLMVLPHPASHRKPESYAYPGEIDLVGQVIGVAMLLEPRVRRAVRD